MLSERLHHDLEVAERATGAFAFGVIIAAFVAVAIGTAVYDIGKWLASGKCAPGGQDSPAGAELG